MRGTSIGSKWKIRDALYPIILCSFSKTQNMNNYRTVILAGEQLAFAMQINLSNCVDLTLQAISPNALCYLLGKHCLLHTKQRNDLAVDLTQQRKPQTNPQKQKDPAGRII